MTGSTGADEADWHPWGKHYDLTNRADLNVLMDDLVALLVDDRVPPLRSSSWTRDARHEGISVRLRGADSDPPRARTAA